MQLIHLILYPVRKNLFFFCIYWPEKKRSNLPIKYFIFTCSSFIVIIVINEGFCRICRLNSHIVAGKSRTKRAKKMGAWYNIAGHVSEKSLKTPFTEHLSNLKSIFSKREMIFLQNPISACESHVCDTRNNSRSSKGKKLDGNRIVSFHILFCWFFWNKDEKAKLFSRLYLSRADRYSSNVRMREMPSNSW